MNQFCITIQPPRFPIVKNSLNTVLVLPKMLVIAELSKSSSLTRRQHITIMLLDLHPQIEQNVIGM
jgi:hypothetical protein